MISIIDYNLGNLRSIAGALRHIDVDHEITNDSAKIARSKGLILPGVGAFSQGMKNLKILGLDKLLPKLVLEDKIPILGICLGFQLLCSSGSEFEFCEGLNIIDAQVARMSPSDSALRLPHVGWNEVTLKYDSSLTNNIRLNLFYFVHSYHVLPTQESDVLGTCDYGGSIVAIIKRDHITGVQFHPEKSQKSGLLLLKAWSDEVENG